MCDQPFAGKVALVTGGASGIGEACVHTFARGGAKVMIADLNADLGARTAATVKRTGNEAVFVCVDVSHPESVAEMIAATIKTFGRLDIAVNNAGIGGELNPVAAYGIETWRKVIDINLNAVFYCMHYEIPRMLEQGRGAIVNMASMFGAVGYGSHSAYVAAKHGVVGLTRAAAIDYSNQGLRINAVGPGVIKTPLLLGSTDEQTQTVLSGLHLVGRMGEAQEVANLVAFLCSDEASFITGGLYLVDGGYTAQ